MCMSAEAVAGGLDTALEAIERAADDGSLAAESVQRLLAAAVRAYSREVAAQPELAPFVRGNMPSETDIAIIASAMLEAAGIEIFELGLWRAWGRAG